MLPDLLQHAGPPPGGELPGPTRRARKPSETRTIPEVFLQRQKRPVTPPCLMWPPTTRGPGTLEMWLVVTEEVVSISSQFT